MLRKFGTISFIVILLAGLVGAAAASPLGMSRAHPDLLEYAAAHPDSVVRVIAAKSHPNSRLAEIVRSLGGEAVHNLSMIDAVAAILPAKSVVELANSPGVRWVAMDGPMESANGKGGNGGGSTPTPTPTNPSNYYLNTLRVHQVWNMGLRGEGISIAIIDSGVTRHKDFQVDPTRAKPDSRIVIQLAFNSSGASANDVAGHGTHVGGIAAGSGYHSNYAYSGIAPKANLISLRVSDDTGMSYESDVVAAMQWVFDNKTTYNIRVVNLSLNSSVESSYHTSPISAAAEVLWFNGIVVVASAGNKGPAGGPNTIRSAPANDPFIITVGASDEKTNSNRGDDTIANFSSSGQTLDGFSKPDIIAPGKDIISVLTGAGGWKFLYPDRIVASEYFRASGTSMAAPMVSGAVALLLQDEPNLTPDQVKYRLLNTATTVGSYPYLDVYAAVTGTTTQSSNTGKVASQLLWTGSNPVNWNSVSWNSVSWNSVSWNSVSWNSVSWNSVSWNSVFFGP